MFDMKSVYFLFTCQKQMTHPDIFGAFAGCIHRDHAVKGILKKSLQNSKKEFYILD